MRTSSYELSPRPGNPARTALKAVLASLVAALFLTGLAAPPAGAAPPTDMALAWGYNEYGQLGDGTTTNRSTPVDVHLPAGVQLTSIAAGYGHSLGLTSDGRVLAWGWNAYGQLGDDTTTDSSTPVEVHLPAGVQVTAIAAGVAHSLAVTSDGRALAWGYNADGELGNGTTTNSATPVEVHLPAGAQVTAVAGGSNHSLALTSDGHVLAWGDNRYGQLGDGTTTRRLTPVEVHLPPGIQVTAIAAGLQHSLAATSDGRAFAWGFNIFGQLGNGTTSFANPTPVEVLLPAGTQVTAVAGGGYHSLALTSDGRVLAWGRGVEGQLGDGTNTLEQNTPVEVHLPTGTQATAIAAGEAHSLALASDGRVLAWGSNFSGQLGDGTTTDRTTPVEVHLPTGVHATAIAAGGAHSLALAEPTESTTTLTASPNPAAAGQPVTLSAHVTCTSGTPTGQVEFTSDGTVIGTTTLDAQGNATLTTTNLALGTHQIIAHYQGAGTCPPSDSTPVTVTIEQAPVPTLHLDKRVQSSGPFHIGDTVAYTYTVTNTGDVPLHNVAVTDDLVTGVTCDATTLAPGQSTTCHGSHTLTQAGQVTNTAHATAVDPAGNPALSNTATATITVEVPPATGLTLTKRVVSKGPFRIGDKVAYAYTVTNTGSTTLNGVTVTDSLVAGVTCVATSLAPGASTTCTGSHTITKADVTPCKTTKERGGHHDKSKHQVMRCQVTNTATASAVDPAGNQTTSNQATATITVTVEKRKEKQEKEHCHKHHSGHKGAYGCDGHHHRVAEQA